MLLTLITRFQAVVALAFSRETRETTELSERHRFRMIPGSDWPLNYIVLFFFVTAFKVTQIFNRIYVVNGKLQRNYKGI